MSQIHRYAFINAKIKARVSRMLLPEQLDALAKSKSVEQLLHQMQQTPYGGLYELYEKSGDLQVLEAAVNKRNIEIHQEITKVMDDTYRPLIRAYTRKLETENIKSMIRLFFSNNIKGENVSYRVSYLYTDRIVDPIPWLDMANARSFEEIISALKGTVYEPVVGQFSQKRIEEEGLFFLESALDHIWVKAVQQLLSSLHKKDSAIIKKVLDTDGDLKNLINVFRYHSLYDLSPEQLESIMFPAGSLRSSREMKKCMSNPMSAKIINELLSRSYPDLAQQLSAMGERVSVRAQVLMVETYLFSIRKKNYQSLLRGDPFSIGTILSYFFLSEQQDSVVKRLLYGIQYELESDIIRGRRQ